MTKTSGGFTVLFAGIAAMGAGCSAPPGDAGDPGDPVQSSSSSEAYTTAPTHLDMGTFDGLMHSGAYISGYVSGAGCVDLSPCQHIPGDPLNHCWKWVGNCSNTSWAQQVCDANNRNDMAPTYYYNGVIQCLDSGNSFYYDPLCPAGGCRAAQ